MDNEFRQMLKNLVHVLAKDLHEYNFTRRLTILEEMYSEITVQLEPVKLVQAETLWELSLSARRNEEQILDLHSEVRDVSSDVRNRYSDMMNALNTSIRIQSSWELYEHWIKLQI